MNAPITLGGATTISSYGVIMNQTLGGAIGGTGGLTIDSQGGGFNHYATWTLNAASNYSGSTTIFNGNGLADVTVKLGITNALPTATSLNLTGIVGQPTIKQHSTLDLNGFSQTLAGLTDTGATQSNAVGFGKRVINSSGTLSTLTINNAGAVIYGTTATRVTAGTIGGTTAGDVAANNLALVKTGAGTLTLNGANTYTGGTTVNAGMLTMGSASALGSTSGQLTVNTSGTLDMGSQNLTVGNLTGTGGVISGTAVGTRTLTIGQGNGTGGNFQGAINNGTGGTTALTKTGNGTITLSGGNGYTGGTIVSGGKLTISSTGTINSTSGISIGAGEFNYNSSTALTQPVSFSGTGGTLSGSSTITPTINVTAGNTLAIGNSVGTMNFGSNLTVGGTYLYELTGGAATADLGDVAGNLTLGGILDLVQLGTYTVGNKFTLFAYDGALSGIFSGIVDDTTFTNAGGIWTMNYNDTTAGTNGGVSASNTYVTITAIPEPRAALLGAIGLIALLRRRRN